MNDYQHHQFYSISELSLDVRKELIKDSYDLSYEWWVDILDCNVKFNRQKIEMSFENVMKYFDMSCHFTIIERKGFNDPYYGEIGFCTMAKSPEHFLWINITLDNLSTIVEKYNLKTM